MASSTIKKPSIWENPINVSVTRKNNSYFDATAVARCSALRLGKLCILKVNLIPSASIPADQTAFTEIATIDVNPIAPVLHTIASQRNNSALLVQIDTNGVVGVLNNSSTATATAGGFRAMIPFFVN